MLNSSSLERVNNIERLQVIKKNRGEADIFENILTRLLTKKKDRKFLGSKACNKVAYLGNKSAVRVTGFKDQVYVSSLRAYVESTDFVKRE